MRTVLACSAAAPVLVFAGWWSWNRHGFNGSQLLVIIGAALVAVALLMHDRALGRQAAIGGQR
jgi:hypothetical protein